MLVNNAGDLVERKPLAEMSEALWRQVIDLNLSSAFFVTQAAAPGMIERRRGAIVNVSSVAAHNGGGPGALAYAASKGGLTSLTKALAKELAPKGIRVNNVSPGLIGQTAFHARFTAPEAFAAVEKTIPIGQGGDAGGGRPRDRLPVRAGLGLPGRRDRRGQRRDADAMRPRGERDAGPPMKIRHLRWWMIGLVFLATLINYVDRQTVSVLKKAITDDLGLSNPDYAAVQNAFLIAYAISQMVSGRLYDAVGTRVGFTISIVVWSIAAAAHAAATHARPASRFWRFVLGFGEAGNWPGAAKAIAEWFPARERALGMGIFNTGAAVGGALSPPLIAWLATTWGWRPTFLITGALGFGWLVLWLALYRRPQEHPWLEAKERAYVLEGRESGAAPGAAGAWRPGWLELLRYRQVWAILVARFLTDPIWWLYVFWLPSYFQEARGFSLQQIGWSAWFPFLAGGPRRAHRGLGLRLPDRARLEPRPGAQDRDDGRGAADSRGHPRDAGREPLRGARVDGGRAVRLPGLDRQRADAAERLLPGERRRVRSRAWAARPPHSRASSTTGTPVGSWTCSATRRSSSRPACSGRWGLRPCSCSRARSRGCGSPEAARLGP